MSMSDREYDFLMFYIKQTWDEMRHIEQLRATVSSLIIALATLIAGFVVQQGFTDATIIMSVFLIVLGIFGAVMVRKLYQLHQFGQERLNEWYAYLKENIPNSEVFKRRDIADSVHQKKFSIFSQIPHNYFWFALHLFISLGGVVTLVLTLLK
ncbi:hypothetical protein FJZ31_33510 [Candidatus Poribacteria bacterium]|nr:hypothetical protein [Candidatus Poribacteria bacterium]